MPYKFETEHKKIKREDDKRIKLTDEQREKIKILYGQISQRKLAKMFNVSRRLIVFIGDPSQLEQNLECRKKRGGWKYYYVKHKHAQAMKTHRQYKLKLNLKGKLKNGNKR